MRTGPTLDPTAFARAATLLALAALPGTGAARPAEWPTPAQRLRQAPIERALPGPGQVAVGRFLSARNTARGPRAGGRTGDYFVRTVNLLAVVRASDGVLLDLAPGPEFRDGMGWGRVDVCRGERRYPLQLLGIALLGAPRPGLEVRGRVDALGVEVRTRYHIPAQGHRLEMESELSNLGRRPLEDVAVCEELGLGNTRVQVPGVGEVRRSQRLRGLFAARREAGVSYLLIRPDGKDLELPLELSPPLLAFDPTLRAEHDRGRLLPGERRRSSRWLVVRPGSLAEALAEALTASGRPRQETAVELPREPLLDGAPPVLLQVRRDGKPFLGTEAAREIELTLPQGGSYSISVLVPGVGEGPPVLLTPGRTAHPRFPVWGTLFASVVDHAGHPLPARLRIRGEHGSADPAFGGDAGLRVENLAYLSGRTEKLLLAPGRYRVTASRGPRYELAEASLRLGPGETRRLALRLRELVRAPGWLSADLHLHTQNSFDSPVTPADRLVAGAAQGVDLLVLTDHNVVTAPPALASLPAASGARPCLVISGQEVTSYGTLIGHFNVFPLEPGRDIPARDTSPAAVFAEAHRRPGRPLVQVNHPRMGSIGYFDQMTLDARSGRAASAYDPGFDLLEVMNGDQLDQPAEIDRVLGDWYQLLNRGLHYVATAGSDGHRLGFQEVGTPRTLILWDENGKGGEVSEAAALSALRAGRVVASSGPFVRFSIDGHPPGSQIRGGRPLRLQLRVDAPAWMPVTTATLVANGHPLRTFRARRGEPVRLEVMQSVRPKTDTWYVVVVRGEEEDPTLLRRGVLPFAVTNPIFVDVDGDGRCLPPASGVGEPAGSPPRER